MDTEVSEKSHFASSILGHRVVNQVYTEGYDDVLWSSLVSVSHSSKRKLVDDVTGKLWTSLEFRGLMLVLQRNWDKLTH